MGSHWKGKVEILGMRSVIVKVYKTWIASRMETAEGQINEMEDQVKEFSWEATENDEKEEKFINALKYKRWKLKWQYLKNKIKMDKVMVKCNPRRLRQEDC